MASPWSEPWCSAASGPTAPISASTISSETNCGATSSMPCCCSRSEAWHLLVAAADLIVVFLAVEVLSLSLYVLTALTFRRGPIEAAMKYFLLGAFASAFLLYGVALSYGAAGTTSVQGLARALAGYDRKPAARPRRRPAARGRPRFQGHPGAVPHVDARRLPGRAEPGHRVHVGRHEGRRVHRDDPGVRRRLRRAPVGPSPGDRRAGRASRWSSEACSRSPRST